LNKSTLGRKERGGIDYGSRSNFFLRGSSLGGFGGGSSLGSGSSRTGFATASSLATTTRISCFFATAGGFATTSGLAAALLALLATEDAIEQGDAATLLHDTLGRTSIAAILTTTGGLNATTRITSLFATTSGLGATSRISATSVTAALLAVMPTEQVQQRGLAALLGGATDVTALVATLFATATRISLFATASRLSPASGIRTTGVAATITSALLALRAITEEVQQRRLAAFRLARHALHVAPGLTAAAGSRIRTRCVTAADFVAAAVEIVSEHSVEQVATEALSAKA
jgi:hypothetical protein